MSPSKLSLPVHIALALGAVVVTSAASAAPPFAEGRLLVRPAPGLSEGKLDKILEKVGGRQKRKLRGLDVRVVEVTPKEELKIARALAKDVSIAYAEPDALLEPVAIVNDPSYGSQWHLPLMDTPTAWQYANGKNVTVAICDTGVYASHPDLAGQVINGWNTSSNSADTSDVNGHGTKVAGVVAAVTNNGVGVASVAPGARILAMRITDSSDGSAFISDMAECVTWAADHGARVANISYSGAAGSMTVWNAGSYMMNKGGLVVVAAANNGTELTYDNSPYVFTAAATTSTDARASYSNYGNFIDIAAPGSGIYTTNSSGSYSSVSGTSFSSPNTAAVAALVMSANPALTPTDVTAIITNTAKDLGAAGWDAYYGHGRVDAGAAVTMAANVQTSDRTAPSVAVVNPGSGATVQDVVAVEVQASDDFGVMSAELLVDGVVVATDTQEDPTSPYGYRFAWDTKADRVSDGTHRLTARAKDAAGNTGSAQDVLVTVKNAVDSTPPVVTSLSPASDATVSGSATLSATASDNVAVASLVVSVNGFECTGTTSVSCTWNLKNVAEGYYTLTATATDTAGYQATESRSVFVKATTLTTTKTRPSRSKASKTTSENPGKGNK